MEFREQLLAREHLHLGAVRLDDVDREPPSLRFRHHALHHLVRKRAPELHLDAVLLLERVGERLRLGRRERRIQDEAAFLLRAFRKARVAVRPAVHEGFVGACGLRERRRQAESENEGGKELHEAGAKLTGSFILCLTRRFGK